MVVPMQENRTSPFSPSAQVSAQDRSQAVLDNIFSRKSVRSYTDQPVSPQQVETILKAAMAAPSGMNAQLDFTISDEDMAILSSIGQD